MLMNPSDHGQGHTDKVWSVDIHPDGQLVASGAEAGVSSSDGVCISTLHLITKAI